MPATNSYYFLCKQTQNSLEKFVPFKYYLDSEFSDNQYSYNSTEGEFLLHSTEMKMLLWKHY